MDSKEVLAENSKLFGEHLPDEKLSLKEKELIALAIGITVKCDGCIVHHTKGCIDAGCTIEEISEMMEVCVAMGGGPATVYAGKSLRIAEELLK